MRVEEISALRMPEPYELVVFDGDETLVAGDVIRGLAEAAGAADELEAIHSRVWEGKLEPMRALRNRIVPLFEGLPVATVEEVVEDQPLSPGARRVGRRITCETAVFTSIVPHAQRLAEEIAADHYRANELASRDGVLTGEIRGGIVEEGKGPVLRGLLEDLALPPDRVIAVGDGPQDRPMFDLAGFAVGVDPKPAVAGAVDVRVSDRDIHLVEPHLRKRGVLETTARGR